MKGKYTRLKLKMLLLVVLGTLIAGAVGIFLLEVVIDGVLQDPFARFFLWGAQNLFGQSPEEAARLYQTLIRDNKQEILTVCIMVLMLIAFYLALGRFTHWLEDIRAATRRVVEKTIKFPVTPSAGGMLDLTLKPLDPGIVFEKSAFSFAGCRPTEKNAHFRANCGTRGRSADPMLLRVPSSSASSFATFL